MMQRLNVYAICLVFGLSILIIINIALQYTEKPYYLISIKNRRNIKITIKVEDGEETYTQQLPFVYDDSNFSLKDNNMDNVLVTTNEINSFERLDMQKRHSNKTSNSAEINRILERARTKIKDDLSNYNFSQMGVEGLEDLLMESGGQPLRTLIISSWRSGSTFLGELVNAVPSTYYHYEPLIMFGIKQITEPKEATKQLSMMKQMFQCNFYGLEDYFEFKSKDLNWFSHGTRLYDYCKNENGSHLCFNAEFTSRLCKLFPFQSMKLVRLRLRPVEEILSDKELNVKVIISVRDPRGVMQSRRHAHFCNHPDCSDPYLVCADMVSDYVHAKEFLQKYPGRLMVMRFEDLALKPNVTSDQILKFLKVDGRQAFDEFLQSHTNVEIPGFQSTSKVSRNIPYKWKTTLDFGSVNKIQMMWQVQQLHIYTICLAFSLKAFIISTAQAETVIIQENHSNNSPNFMKIPILKNEADSSTYMTDILAKARSKIKYETSNYNYTLSGVHGLEDLVMESGGQPLRTLIISSWRSGSTFLGELVNAVLSTYYHYEPLLMFGIKQITEPKEATKQLSMMKQMFKCNFYGLEDYFEFESKDLNSFSHRTRLYDYCKIGNGSHLCFDAEFTSRLCKLFPFQTMKLVRLRLEPVEEILNDKQLNVRVILLVRDPRGVMQSRRNITFCKNSPDCSDPHLVCADMVSDYVAAGEFLQKYPGRLMVIRFEDLALKPNNTSGRILQFLKLDGRQAFDNFLQSHTNVEVAGFHSTYKVSRNIPFKWKSALDFSYVNDIQMACQEAMRMWGYKMAHNETHMKSDDFNFNPIGDYTI